jgi:protoheme IX farnesyltransferase
MDSTITAVARPPASVARDLVALTKPRITLLNLIATAGGYWLAPVGSLPGFVVTALGTGLVVGAANALNCYLERDLDRLMVRTRNRPLPAGRLPPSAALGFGLALAAVGIPLLSLGANPLSALLATLALIGYVLIYTPLKQRSSLALIVGAVPGAAPPLIGWAAATGGIDATGLLLFLLVFLWQIPHFLAITLFRKRDYAEAGFKILPLERGDGGTRVELVLYTLAMVANSLAFVFVGTVNALYLAVAVALGVYIGAVALRGLRADAGPKWARRFFLAINLYLTVLLGALVLDHHLF